MNVILAIAAVAGLIWVTAFVLRGSLLAGCLAFLLAASCFGHAFLQFDLGPLPLTLDRLVLVLLVIAYAIQRQLGRADPKPLQPVDWLMAAFAVLLVISTFTSPWQMNQPGDVSPVWRLLFAYLMPLTLYWIARQSSLSERGVAWVHGALAGFGVYLAVTGIAEVAGQWWLVFPQYIADPDIGIHFGRARGPMVQAACYGACLAICLLSLWTWRARFGRMGQLVAVALLPLFGAALYFSYTRSAWAEAALGMTLLLALTLRGSWRTGVLTSLIAAGLLVGVAKWDSLMGFKREQSAGETRKSAHMRGSFAYVSWKMFQDRPLLGCGFGQYRQQAMPYLSDRSTELDLESIRGYSHHNTLLCILVENGLVGLLLFMGILWGWGRAAWDLYRSRHPPAWARSHAVLMLGCLGIYLCQALSHDVTYTGIENMFVFFLAGMTVGLRPLASHPSATHVAAGRRAVENYQHPQLPITSGEPLPAATPPV